VPRLTKIYLTAFNAQQAEYLLLGTLCRPIEHLHVPQRVGGIALSLQRHWLTAALHLHWNDMKIECSTTEPTWRLPNVLQISLFQYYRLAHVLEDCHNFRLLTGCDDMYQSHTIMIMEHKLKPIKFKLLSPNAARRISV